MRFQERKWKIIDAVTQSGSLSVFELAEKLATSPATIRRDLHDITKEGLLLRTHGGVMQAGNPVLTSFTEKSGVHDSRKAQIGAVAATHVCEGDVIFLDCGSTVFTMCAHLKTKKNITVVTNSLPVAAALMDSPYIQLNLIGGEIDKPRKAVHGTRAVQHVDSYHANKAFIGTDGISVQNGLSAHGEQEASITSAFLRNAKETFLLCDSSKIGRDSYLKYAGLDALTCLITDADIEAGVQKQLEKAGLRIILPEPQAAQKSH